MRQQNHACRFEEIFKRNCKLPRPQTRKSCNRKTAVLAKSDSFSTAYDLFTADYNRFVRWAAKGVWVDIFDILASAGGPPAQVLIDSSAVKAHRCASGGKGGSKIRPLADHAVDAPPKSTR
jgi:transposase